MPAVINKTKYPTGLGILLNIICLNTITKPADRRKVPITRNIAYSFLLFIVKPILFVHVIFPSSFNELPWLSVFLSRT